MSLFKAGSLPSDTMARPSWPRFTPRPEVKGQPGEGEQAAASERANAPPMPAAPAAPLMAEAEDVLRQARLQAAQILQEAANEAEAAVEAARQEGFASGHREGLAAGHAEVERLKAQAQSELEQARVQAELLRGQAEATVQALRSEAEGKVAAMLAEAREAAQALIDEARAEQHRRLDAAQAALVELAVAAAQRLVQGHLAIQPEAVVNMLAAGLRRLKDTNCTVRVSPQDLPLLEAQRSALERELATGFLQLQPDPGMAPGNYIIHSPGGQIDGRQERQAGVMRSALKEALGGAGS